MSSVDKAKCGACGHEDTVKAQACAQCGGAIAMAQKPPDPDPALEKHAEEVVKLCVEIAREHEAGLATRILWFRVIHYFPKLLLLFFTALTTYNATAPDKAPWYSAFFSTFLAGIEALNFSKGLPEASRRRADLASFVTRARLRWARRAVTPGHEGSSAEVARRLVTELEMAAAPQSPSAEPASK